MFITKDKESNSNKAPHLNQFWTHLLQMMEIAGCQVLQLLQALLF
jgi:hypothetical protein